MCTAFFKILNKQISFLNYKNGTERFNEALEKLRTIFIIVQPFHLSFVLYEIHETRPIILAQIDRYFWYLN